MENEKTIQKAFNAFTKKKKIYEATLLVENTDGSFSKGYSYNGKGIDTPIIIASITKMFTATCIIKLCEQNIISFDDKISKYLDDNILKGLHIYKGKEYSYDLTISNLLFQTSGLPDELESNSSSYKNTMNALLHEDPYITFEQTLKETKAVKPVFAPNTPKRAYYANVNYDLLGEILEKVMSLKLDEIYQKMIFAPLGMTKTYLPVNEDDFVPHTYYKEQKLQRPKLIASCRASGGCVSTTTELMVFIKAFFKGKLFSNETFEKLKSYNRVQFIKGPIRYGGGHMQMLLGKITTLFKGKGDLIGHTGTTGSYAFYYPDKDLFFVGDFAQLAAPALTIRFVLRLAMFIK